ncbi:Smoothelin [Nymphon striatum]|nr:Smoothelin [Nymphon striatum]
MKKCMRGTADFRSASDIVAVKWKDNNDAVLLSNFHTYKMGSVQRWDRTVKKYVAVRQPGSIKEYNKYMGFVNLLDQNIKKRGKFIKMDEEEYVNLDEITDEEELNELLEDTDDIDERKKIRTRLLEVKAEKRAKRESKFKKREDDREDALKKKARDAEAQKQRTMAMYDEAAKSAPAGGVKSFNVETYSSPAGSARSTPSRYVGEPKKDSVEDAIKNRMHEAENRKKRILAAYDHAANTGESGSHKQVNFEAFKRADVSEFKPKALQPGASTFGMSGGVPDMKGPLKATLVTRQEPQEFDATEKAIRARVKEAEDHKKKLLAAYDMAAKDGGGPKQVILSNYLTEIEVPSDNRLGVNHSSTGCFSGGIPLYNRPQDKLPVSPRDRFKKMESSVANTPGNNANKMFGPPLPIVRQSSKQIKQTIIDFCRRNTAEYENINITNFSSSWANGLAFCALTHHFYPDAYDYYALKPENRRINFDLAFRMAEECGGVCPLLETDDMIMMKDKPDWKCVFTYVQSLYQKYRNLE